MRALVTGGGGFLGRYIVEQLQARGARVRVFSRGAYPELQAQGVEVVQGDLRSPGDVAAACRGMETVFHVAALPGVWGAWSRYYEINTLGTRHVIAGCQQAGVSKLVYTSSPSVVYDGRSHLNATEDLPYPQRFLCHYPHSKALAEQEVLASNGKEGLTSVALRPHLIWGPRDNHLIPRLVSKARSGRLRQIGAGDNLISMSYVENAAHAHLLAADALAPDSPVAGQAYFINEPEPVNLWQWINDILKLAELAPVKRRISARLAWSIGAALESIYTIGRFSAEPPLTRFVASQLSRSHTYSIAKAQHDFGYAPKIGVEEGLRRMLPDLQRLGGRQ